MTIKFKAQEIKTEGDFPAVGQDAPEFHLIGTDLKEVSLTDFTGKKVVFNIFPSVDTAVCALQLKKFSAEAGNTPNTVFLFASMDLPFALKRFCGSEGIETAVTASDFRYRSLEHNYGVKMIEGPLAGLYARGVLILDEEHKVVYSELVDEVTNEPNYEAAMEFLK